MRPRIATPRPGRRSASAARPATARARNTSPGRAPGAAGGRSASTTTNPRALPFASMSGRGTVWRTDPHTGRPRRNLPPALLRKEVETCGLCHARRASFSEAWVPGRWLSDTHAVAPLTRGLYHADGQMQDEVYNYGSFKQSKMFAAGVTCSDCHDPHSGKLKVSGDGACLQCHEADKYAAATHTHHAAVNPPVACASCHMPARTYMVIDRRHDHSLRVPRPDLSAKLGTPNACNDCHADKSAQWAAAAVERWYGPEREGFQSYAEAFQAAWTDQPDAAKLLNAVAADKNAPAFARASALTELAPHLSSATIDLAREALSDPDPMVRIGALDMLAGAPPNEIWPLASPLLADQSRGVRIRAASLLAAVPTADQPAADRESFERAAAEFIAAQRFNADRPESRAALGTFFAQRGQYRRCRDRIPGGTAFKPALRARRCQPRRSLSPARARRRRRAGAARRALRFPARCRPASRAGTDAGAAEAAGRSPRRIAPCRRTRSRRSADTPMSTPSPCIRSAAAPTPWPFSRTIWRAIPTIATRKRRSSLSAATG